MSIWNPMYENIDLHHWYGISVVEVQISLLQNIPSSGEQGETTVFEGLSYSDGRAQTQRLKFLIFYQWIVLCP